MISAIVAVDKNWGIGSNNKLLVSIPSDMKFFRQQTMGKVVVLGRKTLETFPISHQNNVHIVVFIFSVYLL